MKVGVIGVFFVVGEVSIGAVSTKQAILTLVVQVAVLGFLSNDYENYK